jgi:hypothetical protein
MASSNSPCIDPVVGRVNADEPDQHHSDGIVDFHNQTIPVTADVENRPSRIVVPLGRFPLVGFRGI